MKKLIILLLVLSLTLTASGCWDLIELDQIGLVLLVGIDTDEKGDGFEVTIHVEKPVPTNGGNGDGGGGGTDSIWVASARGQTILDAFRNFRGRAAFTLSFNHTNLFVVGEDLARKGITPVLDVLSRTREIRLNSQILIAQGSAKEFLMTQSDAADTLHEEIEALLQNEVEWSKSVSVEIYRFVMDYLDPGKHPVASRVFTLQPEVKMTDPAESNGEEGDDQIIITQGAAVFNDDQLVDWLTGTETMGYRYITGQGGESIIVVPWHSGFASLEIQYQDCSKKLLSGGDVPHMQVRVDFSAVLLEYTGYVDLSDVDKLKELESLAADYMKSILQSTDRKAKNLGVDFLGYGGILARKNPNYWGEVNEKWREIFPALETSFEVNMQLFNTGTISEPLPR